MFLIIYWLFKSILDRSTGKPFVRWDYASRKWSANNNIAIEIEWKKISREQEYRKRAREERKNRIRKKKTMKRKESLVRDSRPIGYSSVLWIFSVPAVFRKECRNIAISHPPSFWADKKPATVSTCNLPDEIGLDDVPIYLGCAHARACTEFFCRFRRHCPVWTAGETKTCIYIYI